ncbi:MAG TPA: transposase [Firmicutes bacterium]|nr:transposase [Bacillota bacterium]
MDPNNRPTPFRMLVLITKPKLADRAAEMFQRGAIPVQYEWNAEGTASSEMIDVLGLGSSEKRILTSYMPKPFADKALKKLKKELRLGTVNSGIAFTVPMSGANNLVYRMLQELDAKDIDDKIKKIDRKVTVNMSDIKYYLIVVMVNQGYSENVMEAAREAGAGGGTVVPSRRIGNEQAVGFWGMSIQDESDMVLIVADSENKLDIMQNIGKKCGVHSEAKGILISLPIDGVIGFDAME